jgi:hypothetical protein
LGFFVSGFYKDAAPDGAKKIRVQSLAEKSIAANARRPCQKTLRAAAIVVASSLWLDIIRPQAERYKSK